jgi:hypothetical protein
LYDLRSQLNCVRGDPRLCSRAPHWLNVTYAYQFDFTYTPLCGLPLTSQLLRHYTDTPSIDKVMSSYNDDRRGGYGRDDGGYGGGQSGGYREQGGEADAYYNEGERQSGGRGDERRYDDDDRGREHGGQEIGQRYDQNNGGGYGSSGGNDGGYGRDSNYDQDEVINQARQHGNDEDGNLFSQAMSFLGKNKHDNEDIDEQQMVGAHQQLYGNQTNNRPHDANTLGAGAAMQALKMFSAGGAGTASGNSQSQFIGIAMAQAGKLFDQQSGQGNVASGADKQSAVNSAAKLALQMYMKSEGKGGGGGQGGLMGLASRFM